MPPLGNIRWERNLRDAIQPTLDAICIYGSMWLLYYVAFRYFDPAAKLTAGAAVVVFLLISHLTCLHRRWSIRSSNHEIMHVLGTWLLTLVVLGLLGFLTRSTALFPRSLITIWAILTPTLIALSRMLGLILQEHLQRRGIGTRIAAIAGLNQLGLQVAENIRQEPGMGLVLRGFFDDRGELRDPLGGEVAENSETVFEGLQGRLADLVATARRGEIDVILVTLPMRAEKRIRYLLDQLSDSTVSVYIVPDFFVFELLHSRWTSMGGLPAISVFENPLYGVDGLLKRVVDVALAIIALVIAGIPMILIAIAIKLTSHGPVFFRQRRYGLDGKEIRVWKFRTMRICEDGPVVVQAKKLDPRVTPLGVILRRTSIDELPQLFNVLQGSMSLVGPRPHPSAHNEQYRGMIRGYMLRHKVKPGITGLAQVSGCRGETDTLEKMERRVQMDHQYIRQWSLWLDLKILVKTLWVAWRQPEAY